MENYSERENRNMPTMRGFIIWIIISLFLTIGLIWPLLEYNYTSISREIKMGPILIIVGGYLLYNRKWLFRLFILVSTIIYIGLLYDLSNPFIKDYLKKYEYSKLNGEINVSGKSTLDISNRELTYDCNNLDLTLDEHCRCIDLLSKKKMSVSPDTIQYQVESYMVDYEEGIDNEKNISKALKYLEYGKKIQMLDFFKANEYFQRGLQLSKKENDKRLSFVFKYYLGVGEYLKGNIPKSKRFFNEIIKESNDEELKMISDYTLLQIRKNNYELTTQEDLNLIVKKTKTARSNGYKGIEFLLHILKGDFYNQAIFLQSARDVYISAEKILPNEKIERVLPAFYARLAFGYKSKGALERYAFYSDKSTSLGNLKLNREGDITDFFISDISINSEGGVSYFFKKIVNREAENILATSLLLLHHASQDSCISKVDEKKELDLIEASLSIGNINTSVKRTLSFNLAKYYNIINDKQMAKKFIDRMVQFDRCRIEKLDSYYHLGSFYLHEMRNVTKSLEYANKCIDYCANKPINNMNLEEAINRGLAPKERIGKDFFWTELNGQKGYLLRHGTTTKSIEVFKLLSNIYHSIYYKTYNEEDIFLLYSYLDIGLSYIQSLWKCTTCESDRHQLSVFYYNMLDLYIRVATDYIEVIGQSDLLELTREERGELINSVYAKLYVAIELIKMNKTLFGLNKNFRSFLRDKSILAEEVSNLDKEISSINNNISLTKGKSVLDSLTTLKYKFYSKKDKLVDQISEKYPDFFVQSTPIGTTDFKLFDLMNLLGKDEVFIDYYHSHNNNLLFTYMITQENMVINYVDLSGGTNEIMNDILEEIGVDLPENDSMLLELKKILEKYNLYYVMDYTRFIEKKNVEEGFVQDYSEASYRMYELFFPPLSDKFKRVYISNHIITNYLPFELFLTEEKKGNVDYSTLPYLFKKHEVVYVPSGLSLEIMKSKHEKVVNSDILNVAPFLSDGIRVDSMKMGDLNSSKQITSFFEGKKNVKSLTGEVATSMKVKEVISDYSVLHFSTHGILDINEPMNSALAMYSVNGDKDVIKLHELYNLKLKAKLAVLGACETGESLMTVTGGADSFINAFHYAGCPTVVGTQWKVNDTSTGEILVYFYEFLEEGKTVSDALRSAKLKYLAQDRRDAEYHPYYWGGLVVSGNPDTKISFD